MNVQLQPDFFLVLPFNIVSCVILWVIKNVARHVFLIEQQKKRERERERERERGNLTLQLTACMSS